MQPSEDNKPGVGTSPNLKSRKTKWKRNKTGPSQTTAALLRSASDAGSADEDDDASSAAEVSQHRCIRAFRNALKSFMPGWTPVFMYCTLVLAILLIAFSHASEGNAPDFKFYGIYLAVSGALLALPLFLRVIWIFFFGKGLFVFTGRIYASLAAVLDPEITYLISTITIAIFWANAFTLVGETSGPMVTYRFLNNPSWTMSAGVADRDSMTNVEVLLIIWASRNVVVSAVMFYFLVGFLMNVNSKLVKFLTIYSLVRKLNANWIRLTPILTELANYPSPPGEDDDPGFIDFRDSRRSIKGQPSPIRNLVEAPFQGLESQIQVPTPAAKNEEVLEELIAAEAKERRPSKSQQSQTALGATLERLNSTAHGPKKSKKNISELYNVEFAGRSLPAVMMRRNIQKTQTDGVANLLAIQFVRSNPVVLFVRGTRVELRSKKLTKLVAKRIFEELIEFRNSVAPEDQELSTQQMDQLVKQTVIQSVETTLQRQSSGSGRSVRPSLDFSRNSVVPHQSFSVSTDFPTPPDLNGAPSPAPPLPTAPTSASLAVKSAASLERDAREISKPPLKTLSSIKLPSVTKSPQVEVPRAEVPPAESSPSKQSVESENGGEQEAPYSISILGPTTGPPTPESEQDFTIEASPPKVTREEASHSRAPDAPAASGPAVHFLRQKQKTEEDERQFLTRELFELFTGDQVDEFMLYADPGGCCASGRGRVSRWEFVRMIIEIYQLRKQLLELVDSQEGIRNVFRRMVSFLLTFISMLILLGVVGVSVTTLIISGAASFSSFTVSMSFLYSGFIQSVLFVCFLNPYNVGDRVRIEDNMHTVKKISTYFTEFNTSHGKPVFWNHSTLYGMKIVNESRNRNAGLEIPIVISFDTPPSKYEALHKAVHDFVQNNNDFVKDSCTCVMGDVVLGHFIKFTYWITLTESWHNWKSVWASRGRLMKFIIRHCRDMNISYRLPIQPILTLGDTVFKGQSSSDSKLFNDSKILPLEFRVQQSPPRS